MLASTWPRPPSMPVTEKGRRPASMTSPSPTMPTVRWRGTSNTAWISCEAVSPSTTGSRRSPSIWRSGWPPTPATRGAVRTAWQADVEAELAAAAMPGASVSHERIDRALAGLDDVAGLEAWRASARLAVATGRADLRQAAEQRAELLAERSGDWAEMVRGYTSAVIARISG